MNKWLATILGAALLVFALAGMAHGISAGLSHLLNYQAKFGRERSRPDLVIERCIKAQCLSFMDTS